MGIQYHAYHQKFMVKGFFPSLKIVSRHYSSLLLLLIIKINFINNCIIKIDINHSAISPSCLVWPSIFSLSSVILLTACSYLSLNDLISPSSSSTYSSVIA
jgi:hypothetical protein